MKKMMVVLTVLVMVMTMGGVIANAQTETNYYPLTAIVTSVDGNEVTAISINGNVWKFLDEEEYYTSGDMVSLLMDNKNTDLVFDDEIIKVHYCGNVSEWHKMEIKNKMKKMVK